MRPLGSAFALRERHHIAQIEMRFIGDTQVFGRDLDDGQVGSIDEIIRMIVLFDDQIASRGYVRKTFAGELAYHGIKMLVGVFQIS